MSETEEHPPSHELDALAAGDDASAETEAHVAACKACDAYVEELRDGVAKFRLNANGADFAQKIAEIDAIEEATSKVISNATSLIVHQPAPKSASRNASARWTSYAMYAAPMLAMAAAIFLFVNSGTLVPNHDAPPQAQDSARFKGQLPVFVIRDRNGKQDRLEGPFMMRPGDRIRIEIDVDHAQPLTAGLLSEDGTWVLLLTPTMLEPGTVVPENAATADDKRTDAMLLVGSPDAVLRARKSRNFDDVIAWHVTTEP